MSPSQRIPNADRVAQSCYDRFAQLPKTGRPTAAEWTVLSAILQYTPASDRLEVVSLGTGTKCLSQDQLSSTGDRLNDSHAEIMARRGFVRYLLHAMRTAVMSDNVDDDDYDDDGPLRYDRAAKRFALSDRVSYHFFSSHPPCGDASIFAHDGSQLATDDAADGPGECKRRRIESCAEPAAGEILRGFTGGKLVHTAEEKEHAATTTDRMAQDVEAVRTKPGRGVRTLSVSCSDKLSRWSLVGVQGGLLHALLATGGVYVESVTLAGVCDLAALERAIWRRWTGGAALPDSPAIRGRPPAVQRTSGPAMAFAHEQRDDRQPAPGSIVWCSVPLKYARAHNVRMCECS